MCEAEWRKLKHTKLLYEAVGFAVENAFALHAKIFSLTNAISPHWGLNPGPSVYKTDALPLSYRGICLCGGNKYNRHIIVDWWKNSDGSTCAMVSTVVRDGDTASSAPASRDWFGKA